MSKEDFVWVGIRVFGIYLLVLAVLSVPNLAHSLLMAIQMHDFALHRGATGLESSSGSVDAMSDMMGTIFGGHVTASVTTAIRLLACTAFGIYFLRHGEYVFRLACRPLGGDQPSAGSEGNE